jgi:hypothetical protein
MNGCSDIKYNLYVSKEKQVCIFLKIINGLLLSSVVGRRTTRWIHMFHVRKQDLQDRKYKYMCEQHLLVLSSLLLSPVYNTFGVCVCACVRARISF